MLSERHVCNRDTRHQPLARGAFDRTAHPRDPRVARLTEHRVDPREELGRLEGLGDVVRRTAGEAADLVDDFAARRQEDDRDRRGRGVALDPKTDVVAVGIRKHHVEEHEVRKDLFDELDPPTAVMSHRDDHPVRLQASLKDVGRSLVVLDDDDSGGGCIGADRVFDGLHFFFDFLVPSVSPRSQRIATMNFDGRSSRVFSAR